MNWSRAKTILIIMFLCTAVFQSFVLYTSEKKANNLSPEIIASTVEILAENEIFIDAEIIPTKNYTLPLIEVENAISEYQDFAKLILGSELTKNSDTEFSSQVGTISFSGNRFDAKTTTPANANIKTELSAQKTAKEILTKIGIDLKDTSADVKKSDDGYELNFINMPQDVPVLNSNLTLSMTPDSVSLRGNWFNITDKSGTVKLKSITAVLIDCIKENIEKPAKITDIKLGYIIPESDKFQKSASLVPVWQFTFENGKQLIIDARSTQ